MKIDIAWGINLYSGSQFMFPTFYIPAYKYLDLGLSYNVIKDPDNRWTNNTIKHKIASLHLKVNTFNYHKKVNPFAVLLFSAARSNYNTTDTSLTDQELEDIKNTFKKLRLGLGMQTGTEFRINSTFSSFTKLTLYSFSTKTFYPSPSEEDYLSIWNFSYLQFGALVKLYNKKKFIR